MWPGRIAAGSVSDQVALLMDLLPTLCEAAGCDLDHVIEGRSILPTLLGQRQDFAERVLYWVRREGSPRFLGLCQHAVRQGDLKAVVAVGCLVQRYKDDLESEIPEVDVFMGLTELGGLVPELRSRGRQPDAGHWVDALVKAHTDPWNAQGELLAALQLGAALDLGARARAQVFPQEVLPALGEARLVRQLYADELDKRNLGGFIRAGR